MKKYMIIGGAGFIGSHVSEALLKLGQKVVIVDDFSTGSIKNTNPKVTIYKKNIDSVTVVNKIFKKEKPDVVYHLAGAINLRRPVSDPLFIKSLDVLGRTKIILDACKSNNVKKIIFVSSGGAIYEGAKVTPTPEDYPSHPISLYGLANLTIEKYIENYCKEYDLHYAILRLSNVYGPRQWKSGVIPAFVINLLNNKKPTINGDGLKTIDFVYIDDVVDALLIAAQKKVQGLYNVASGKEINLNEVIQLVTDILHIAPIKPIYQKSSDKGFKRSALDIQKIKKEFGWQPKVNFKEGLTKTISWFKKSFS